MQATILKSLQLFILLSCVANSFMPVNTIAQTQKQNQSTKKSNSQSTDTTAYWHGKVREIRYHPEGTDIVITNGKKRFTRALYGTNTAFRIEAGDLPEFAIYMPGMGGNFKFGIIAGTQSKWLIDAAKITARYRPGSMIYEIEDPLLGNGKLLLTIWALAKGEGLIVQTKFSNIPNNIKLITAFGGASGKKFSRDGEMNVDPESGFYLNAVNCRDNRYQLQSNGFNLSYGTGVEQYLQGLFPLHAEVKLASALMQESPAMLISSLASNDSPAGQIITSNNSKYSFKEPLVLASLNISSNQTDYFSIYQPKSISIPSVESLVTMAQESEAARVTLTSRVLLQTPDPYLNTLGGVLSIAADAIWESPSYLHGSIGWRMRLNGWRGPYVADPLGWHDRARSHFSSYALSQVTSPLTAPNEPDTLLHFARQKERLGNTVFSSGYISRNPGGDLRAHHYDMNLVFVDALLRHFQWTGDTAYMRQMWPLIKRHLDWEKRNFDQDGDGLYDAYAAIWASDALQYSGGGVTHSSAYNFKGNAMATKIAAILGEDGMVYEKEANKILKAMNEKLWLPQKGWYAEFKDLLGNQLLHENPAMWTAYHNLDSEVPDPFQAYQTMRYVDNYLPHIPIKAKNLEPGLFTISTSNWMPYIWSLNNVALAEVMHTALAQWQAGKNETAFTLWKSALIESMYLGNSAGNLVQISFYDAARGETYRDFADPVAMTARSLVEGLFGIVPNALDKELTIKPGFPKKWDHTNLQLPDVGIDYKKTGLVETYLIRNSFAVEMDLNLQLKALSTGIDAIVVNSKTVSWKNISTAVGSPSIEIKAGYSKQYQITIQWKKKRPIPEMMHKRIAQGELFQMNISGIEITGLKDTQGVLKNTSFEKSVLKGHIIAAPGSHSLFVQLKKGEMIWWQPIDIDVVAPIEFEPMSNNLKNQIVYRVRNNTSRLLEGKLVVNGKDSTISIPASNVTANINISSNSLVPGSNQLSFNWQQHSVTSSLLNWNIDLASNKQIKSIDLQPYLKNKVTDIFKVQYLSPRPTSPTLQMPTQGIGEWTYPLRTVLISDSGFRKNLAGNNQVHLPQGIYFSSKADSLQNNILFTSQWENYPSKVSIPISGKASHAYFLMAGSTNTMQSRMVNGVISIEYMDGSVDSLELKNPENWWPIEQDYLDDGYAFQTNATKPVRIHFRTGKVVSVYDNSINDFNGKTINGGAATVLDLPLDKTKMLNKIVLKTVTNEVVIGLMAVSLIREN